MNFKKLKSQSGRSMVEMLGVLAIIGVLSVGGIAGYSLSMRRHRANQIVDLASKYALVAYGRCQQKIINGEINDFSDCIGEDLITFREAGLGNLPAGVDFGWLKFEYNSTRDYDLVTVSSTIDDDKLCQAVAAIVGEPCSGGVVIPVKQN